MRKYFTWRCIGLHLLVLVLVPAFVAAGWWQYNVARGGNDLSWVYTVEWPFFAVYALYIWWKLIHDRSTPFDRLWAAKQRAAADASGTPLHQIPGWATDKQLSRTIRQASIGAGELPALAHARTDALESADHRSRRAAQGSLELGNGAAGNGTTDDGRAGNGAAGNPTTGNGTTDDGATGDGDGDGDGATHHHDAVIDARVVAVTVDVDEELEAYNRYLFDLSWKDPPKRWKASRRRGDHDESPDGDPRSSTPATQEGGRPELPSGDAARDPT